VGDPALGALGLLQLAHFDITKGSR
jgi:hypothetical protein